MKSLAFFARSTPPRFDRLHALAVIGAAGAFFSLANPVARLPLLILVFHWCLARIAFLADSPRQAAWRGYLCGVLAAWGNLYWVAIPVHDYADVPWVLAAPCPGLMGCVLGLYPAAFAWVLARAKPGLPPLVTGLLAGALWWCVEMERGWLFTGFPWTCSAAALTPWPFALQSLALVGAWGLGGLLAASAAWLAVPGRAVACRTAGLALLVALGAQGSLALRQPIQETGSFRAAVIQGNVDQSVKWDPAFQAATVDHYLELSDRTLPERPDILIWPETALPFYIQNASSLTMKVKGFCARTGLPLVAGAPGFRRDGKDLALFNRAFLITTAGLEAFYDKEHLVPFGEYAPFGKDLPLLESLMQGVGGFTPGRHTAPLRSGRLAMGMLICYESIFPELAQKRVSQGANVLVNISNDAWYGRSATPYQHLDLAVLRAVEQGRCLVRATNTGISALVDPKGRVLGATALFEDAAVTFGPVPLVETITVFHRLHDLLPVAAAFAAIGLFAAALYRQRGK